MAKEKIKTEWAAIRITAKQAVIISTQIKDKPKSLFFSDLNAFRKSLVNKEISMRRWAISVPDDACIKKTLDLPAQSLDEAARMAEFELISLVPIPPENMVYGCAAIKQEENVFEVSIYILRNDILDKFLEPYHEIGVYPEKIVPDSVALFSSISGTDTGSSIFLYLDKSKCHILTSLKGNIRSWDCLPIFDIDSDEAKEHLINSLAQNEQELKTFTGTTNIVLTSNIEQTEDLTAILKDSELLSLITVTSRSDLLPDNAALPFYDGLLTTGAFQTISDSRYEHLNLLPAAHLNLIKKRRKIKSAVLTTTLSIVILSLLWANFFIWNWRTSRACRKVQGLIAPIEHIATDVGQKKLLVRALQNQLSTGREITTMFRELYQYSPKSITICNLQYKQKTGKSFLTLKGQTDSLPQAFDYSEAMKKSQLLKQIQITNVQQTPTPGGSIVEFKAECLLQDQK